MKLVIYLHKYHKLRQVSKILSRCKISRGIPIWKERFFHWRVTWWGVADFDVHEVAVKDVEGGRALVECGGSPVDFEASGAKTAAETVAVAVDDSEAIAGVVEVAVAPETAVVARAYDETHGVDQLPWDVLGIGVFVNIHTNAMRHSTEYIKLDMYEK